MKLQTTNYKLQTNDGQAVITAVVFFLFISLAIIAGFAFPVLKESAISRESILSKKSYFLAEAGIEDISYRIKTGRQYDADESLTLDGFAANIAVTGLDDKEITSNGNVLNLIRKVKTKLTTDSSASFNYGVQIGEGGLIMKNNSLVSGNVYSNGQIQGFNLNVTKGDIVSAGPDGLVNGVHATGTVYSHNISNSTVDRDVYYVNIANTSVGGNFYPGSPDKQSETPPISDSQIEEWKTAAAISEIISPCPYIIESNITLGPVKISCDVQIKGSPTVNLTGPIWVMGNLIIENTAIIQIDSSLGKKSVAIIADNPANRLTNSKILLQNSVEFRNSGTDGSYILVISQNNSGENNGSEKAIEIENNVSGDLLLYAGHGTILLENNVNLKEVTAYKIELENNANVLYETGLASLLFESGPAGGYSFSGWLEIQ